MAAIIEGLSVRSLLMILFLSFWPSGLSLMAAAGGKTPDVLTLVEADQSVHVGDQGQDGPDGRINLAAIALHYAHVSSYRDGGKASVNAIDGKQETAWLVANTKTESWIEVSLGMATPIHRIVLIEPKPIIRWHRVSIHDANGWRPLYEVKGLDPQGRSFPTVLAGALLIEIRTSGGGGLSEIGVYRDPSQTMPTNPVVTLRPEPRVVGTSMEYVGFSSVHLVEGENQAAWLRYMGMNGASRLSLPGAE